MTPPSRFFAPDPSDLRGQTDLISERLARVRRSLAAAARASHRDPDTVALVAVSKRHPCQAIQAAMAAGVTLLGENYIQEAVDKIETIGPTAGVRWHFIGHLQSNKARFAVQYFDLIHTVDTFKLAREISKQAGKRNKTQAILMQVNIAEEASKSGVRAREAVALAREIATLPHVRLEGIMGMPPFFDDPETARPFFQALAGVQQAIAAAAIPGVTPRHLSMGMSHDFKVAIAEGATLVRIGTAIFGSRP